MMLIDLAMPDLPGLLAIPRLREAQPGLGIIALTLHDTEGYRQASLKAGADDFVAKARLTDDLLPAIRRVALAGGGRRGIAGDGGQPQPEATGATASADV
jgi:two-component system NarL family response regulator